MKETWSHYWAREYLIRRPTLMEEFRTLDPRTRRVYWPGVDQQHLEWAEERIRRWGLS